MSVLSISRVSRKSYNVVYLLLERREREDQEVERDKGKVPHFGVRRPGAALARAGPASNLSEAEWPDGRSFLARRDGQSGARPPHSKNGTTASQSCR